MTGSLQRPRPTMVTVLGWIWIGLGTFATLTSLMVLLMLVVVGGPIGLEAGHDPEMAALPGWGVMDWVFRHFEWLAVGQLVLAVLILVAGVELLRLRRWARTFLEGICWLGLAYSVGFGSWWAFAWVEIAGQVPEGDPHAPSAALMSGFGIGAMVMVVLFYGIPAGVLIWLLRHETVRAALRPAGGEAAG